MSHPDSGPSRAIPESLANDLRTLEDESLREVISFVQTLLRKRAAQTTQIEAAPGEEIIHIEELDGYTLVTKTHECVDGCDDCPHGPYLYRMKEEHSAIDNESTLHWVFLGRIEPSHREP